MKHYLGERLLFVDMRNSYTYCVVEGKDRVLCCQKTKEEAEKTCALIRRQRLQRIDDLKELLETGHAYSDNRKSLSGTDPRELYPTAGLLAAAIKRIEKTARTVRVVALTCEP